MTIESVFSGERRWHVECGDSAEVLARMPMRSVHAVVTDPPAGVNFMNLEFDRDRGGRAQWVTWLANVLGLARAATVPGGRAFVWALPRTTHWTGCAVEDAGWAIETVVTHLFGTGWPKGKSQLKPSSEHWYLARTGPSTPLNVEACRVASGGPSPSIERREAALKAGRGPASVRPCGIEDRSSLETYTAPREGEASGRWPPNTVFTHAPGCVLEGTRRVTTESGSTHIRRGATTGVGLGYGSSAAGSEGRGHHDPDGTETVDSWRCVEGCPVRELDAQSGERPGFKGGVLRRGATTGKGLGYGLSAVQEPVVVDGYADTGTAARFFPQFAADDSSELDAIEALFRYEAKPSREEREAGTALGGIEPMTCKTGLGGEMPTDDRGAARDRTIKVARNTHPTVKPVALMRWLIRLVSQPGDVILDPFGGSGTTGVAALLEGRRVILVEREPRFAEIARARLQRAAPTRERLATLATEPVKVNAPDFGPLFGGAR